MRRWIADLDEHAAHIVFEVTQVRGIDDEHALARVRLYAETAELATVTAVFTVRAEKVTEVHGYFSDESLLAKVGHI